MAFKALDPVGRVLPHTPAGSVDLHDGGGGLTEGWNPGSWPALLVYGVSPLDNHLSVLGGPFSCLRQRDRRKAAQTYIAPPPVHDDALNPFLRAALAHDEIEASAVAVAPWLLQRLRLRVCQHLDPPCRAQYHIAVPHIDETPQDVARTRETLLRDYNRFDTRFYAATENRMRRLGGSACGIRTRGLRLERAASWAARPMRHDWLGILDSNQGLQIQSLLSYR